MEKKREFSILAILFSCLAFSLALGGLCRIQQNRNDVHRLEMLEEEIRGMSRITAARQSYREVIYSEGVRALARKEVLFSAVFSVEAGVNLEKCRFVRKRRGYTVLYLPPVEIFSVDCDETSIEQYFHYERFTRICFSDYADVLAGEKERILEEARQSDLSARAEENIKDILGGIFRSAGKEDIVIRFSLPRGQADFGGGNHG